jgi:hypothetical protein
MRIRFVKPWGSGGLGLCPATDRAIVIATRGLDLAVPARKQSKGAAALRSLDCFVAALLKETNREHFDVACFPRPRGASPPPLWATKFTQVRDGIGRGCFAVPTPRYGTAARPSFSAAFLALLAARPRQSTSSWGEGRRPKAATFRAGNCGAPAPNLALIGRIASSLFRACYLPVISLFPPC